MTTNSQASRARIEAFFAEFRFLHGFLRAERIFSVKVQRIDSELLSERAYEPVAADAFPPRNARRINIFDKDGRIMRSVAQNEKMRNPAKRWWNIFTPSWIYTDGQTVQQALEDMTREDQKQVGFIVVVHDEFPIAAYGRLKNFACEDITVYKLPNKYDLISWLDEQRRNARESMRREVVLASEKHRQLIVWQPGKRGEAGMYTVYFLDSPKQVVHNANLNNAIAQLVMADPELSGIEVINAE